MDDRKSVLVQEKHLKASFGSKLRNWPWVTLTLIAVSWLLYLPNEGQLMHYLRKSDNGLLVIFVAHPVFHIDLAHILGNTIGLLIVGTLIESWMATGSRHRILAKCYLVSLGSTYLFWKVVSNHSWFPPVGLSGMISSGVPFLLLYYLLSPVSSMRLGGWNKLAPIGIGFAFASLVLSDPSGLTGLSRIQAEYANKIHFSCFMIAFCIALRPAIERAQTIYRN